jgi:hypothetical protein
LDDKKENEVEIDKSIDKKEKVIENRNEENN